MKRCAGEGADLLVDEERDAERDDREPRLHHQAGGLVRGKESKWAARGSSGVPVVSVRIDARPWARACMLASPVLASTSRKPISITTRRMP